jgi:hypothetical protein
MAELLNNIVMTDNVKNSHVQIGKIGQVQVKAVVKEQVKIQIRQQQQRMLIVN